MDIHVHVYHLYCANSCPDSVSQPMAEAEVIYMICDKIFIDIWNELNETF